MNTIKKLTEISQYNICALTFTLNIIYLCIIKFHVWTKQKKCTFGVNDFPSPRLPALNYSKDVFVH